MLFTELDYLTQDLSENFSPEMNYCWCPSHNSNCTSCWSVLHDDFSFSCDCIMPRRTDQLSQRSWLSWKQR